MPYNSLVTSEKVQDYLQNYLRHRPNNMTTTRQIIPNTLVGLSTFQTAVKALCDLQKTQKASVDTAAIMKNTPRVRDSGIIKDILSNTALHTADRRRDQGDERGLASSFLESYTPEQNEQLSRYVGGVLAHCMCCAYTLANIVVAWRSTQRVARSAQRVGGGNGGAMLGRDINVLLNIVPLPTGFIIN